MIHTLACTPLLLLSLLGGQALAGGSQIDLTRRTGEIALADWPVCNFFIIDAKGGFSLATWQSGLWWWEENDAVYGPVEGAGTHTILVAGRVMSGEMTVEFEETGADLRRAQKVYYKRCHAAQEPPLSHQAPRR
jgi:hypothetical protein